MDTSSPMPIIKAMLPKAPLIGKTALIHTLGLSETSKHWDLRTALTVNVLRSFIEDSSQEPISKVQRFVISMPNQYLLKKIAGHLLMLNPQVCWSLI